jgi:hypothetical protein
MRTVTILRRIDQRADARRAALMADALNDHASAAIERARVARLTLEIETEAAIEAARRFDEGLDWRTRGRDNLAAFAFTDAAKLYRAAGLLCPARVADDYADAARRGAFFV